MVNQSIVSELLLLTIVSNNLFNICYANCSALVSLKPSESCVLCRNCRWRGSIYKFVWTDFALFAFLYFLISLTYRFFLDEQSKRFGNEYEVVS